MNTFYTVIETQVSKAGKKSNLVSSFDDINLAWGTFFDVCSAAVKSDLPYHSAVMIASDGRIIDARIFDRREEVSKK